VVPAVSDANLGYLLDGQASLQLPTTWPLKRWAPMARDRIGEIGAITCLQRSSATGFFAMTTIYVRRNVDWEPEFENGDLWPQPPILARPTERRPIGMLTGVSGAAVGPVPTHVAFTAGVTTTSVANLRAASAIDEHDVRVDERTGAFVALTLHASDATTFHLVAFDDNGREIDRIDYQDPWSMSD
jgi:hypothetical protein